MARRNVYLPDDLDALVSALPGVNLSAVLQEALRGVLDCEHRDLRCATCAEEVPRFAVRDEAVGAYYADLMWELREVVDAGGTAEGAARVAKRVAEGHAVSVAERLPLPRLSRRRREQLAAEREARAA